MRRLSVLLFPALLPFLLACPHVGDPYQPPKDPAPGEPSIFFAKELEGRSTAVAGEWRALGQIYWVPAFNARVKVRFSGPGTFTDPNMVPLDPNKEYPGAGGYYLPPPDVPPEGAIAKLGCSVWSPWTNRWESSPDYEIKVTKRTTPMDFYIGHYPGYPAEATVKPGEEALFSVNYRPYPASQPTPIPDLVPPSGYSGDPGSARMEPIGDGSWRCVYKAPAQVPGPMDMKIRFTAEDPWVPQQHEIFFTVHIQP